MPARPRSPVGVPSNTDTQQPVWRQRICGRRRYSMFFGGRSSKSWVRPRQRLCCGEAQRGGWEISRNSESLPSREKNLNMATPFRQIGSTQTNGRTQRFKPSYKMSAPCYWS